MSRSRQHSPVTGIACCRSEARDKRTANRRFRRRATAALWRGEPGRAPVRIEAVSDVWCMGKDGKCRYPSLDRPWPDATPEQARRLFKK